MCRVLGWSDIKLEYQLFASTLHRVSLSPDLAMCRPHPCPRSPVPDIHPQCSSSNSPPTCNRPLCCGRGYTALISLAYASPRASVHCIDCDPPKRPQTTFRIADFTRPTPSSG
ncbi:hypothetical protein L210DRAFT_3545150 [Boletus edulis BED1]|uniref:Uncharacterized protein n=1 Tax=Boletus edulis BED1 TaxID=1328754 RepID=A0AAD4GCU2_BOLED|nr:hypothetical protein L210DRAFT_3545150 [Boletus edulis BED1]